VFPKADSSSLALINTKYFAYFVFRHASYRRLARSLQLHNRANDVPSGLAPRCTTSIPISCKCRSGAQQYHLRDIAERKEKTLRKVTLVGTCVLGGLVIASLAPQAQAQLVLHKKSFTTSVSESSLNFSDSFLLPQFNNLVHAANTQLYGVVIQETTSGSIFGTVTNNSGSTESFGYQAGLLTSSPVPGSGSLNTSALFTKNLTLGAGGSFSFTTPITGTNSTTLMTNAGSLVAYQGNGNVSVPFSGVAWSGFSGPTNGVSASLGTTGLTGTVKMTYFYYSPFTPVPELGTSISLGLMGLVGGALGLRARRRK